MLNYSQDIQNEIKVKCAVKGKFLFMPLRTALTGQPHGAELKLLVPLLEKKTIIERAAQALAQMSHGSIICKRGISKWLKIIRK